MRISYKNKKGITLIALVITIIVILILSGIAVTMLTGDNGLLNKTTTAKIKTEEAEEKEKIKLAYIASITEKFGNTNKKIELKDELKKNLENEYGEGKVTVEENEQGYNIEIEGIGKYIIDKDGNVNENDSIQVSDVKITLEDGTKLPEEKVAEGTKLKIASITAKIKNGKIESIEPKTPYITDGNTRKIKFTITGKNINNITYTKEYTLDLSEYYKEMEAAEITQRAQMYYGAEVTGYTCESKGVDKWRLFYADATNVYLIADDYIHYDNVPKGKNGTPLIKSETYPYRMNFGTSGAAGKDYSGSEWILGQTDGKDNCLAKDWLNMFFNYSEVITEEDGTETITYPNKTNTSGNVKVTAYMLDTTVWGIYAGEYAHYAIGGPPLELYAKSYNQVATDGYITLTVDNTFGYKIGGKNYGVISTEFNQIYQKPYSKDNKAHGMWIPSSTKYNQYNWYMAFAGNDSVGSSYYPLGSKSVATTDAYGFRPVVCLKQGVQLLRTGEEEFKIVGIKE